MLLFASVTVMFGVLVSFEDFKGICSSNMIMQRKIWPYTYNHSQYTIGKIASDQVYFQCQLEVPCFDIKRIEVYFSCS